MAIIRATAVLTPVTGVERDASRNVWHFATGGAPTTTGLANLGNALAAFYDALGGTILGRSVARAEAAHRIEMAMVTQGGAGAEDDSVSELLATVTFGALMGTTSAAALPEESAVALSFRGDIEGLPEEQGLIRPRARKRGRVYLGPLQATVCTQEADTFRPMVSAAARTTILNAFDTLMGAIAAPVAVEDRAQFVVYSRASATIAPVVLAHVDDSLDVIRRRHIESAARTELAVVPTAIV